MSIPERLRDRRTWIRAGVGLLVVTGLGMAAWELTHPNTDVPVTPSFQPESLPTAFATPEPTLTPPPTPALDKNALIYDQALWMCATVNNPVRTSSYDPFLPTIPNAFRAIEQAGNATIWEEPPYLYIDNAGRMKTVSNWNELSLVWNGNDVCVLESQVKK